MTFFCIEASQTLVRDLLIQKFVNKKGGSTMHVRDDVRQLHKSRSHKYICRNVKQFPTHVANVILHPLRAITTERVEPLIESTFLSISSLKIAQNRPKRALDELKHDGSGKMYSDSSLYHPSHRLPPFWAVFILQKFNYVLNYWPMFYRGSLTANLRIRGTSDRIYASFDNKGWTTVNMLL